MESMKPLKRGADEAGDESDEADEADKPGPLTKRPTLARATELQARLDLVLTAVEAAEGVVWCAEQRLTALQAENCALWSHFADAAAYLDAGARDSIAPDSIGINSSPSSALQGVAHAVADAAADLAGAGPRALGEAESTPGTGAALARLEGALTVVDVPDSPPVPGFL